VERVVPNALFDSAIRKRLEDKPLDKPFDWLRALSLSKRLWALSSSNGSLHPHTAPKPSDE
jgi:hypothetical protein